MQYPGQQVADLTPGQNYGIQGITNLAGGTPYTQAAGDQLYQTLTGQGSNPFNSQVVDQVTNDATRAYNAATGGNLQRFQGPDRYSSAAQQTQDLTNQDFARGLSSGLAAPLSAAYEAERGRQMQAAQAAPGLLNSAQGAYQNAVSAGDIQRQQQQQLINAQIGNFNDWRNYPTQQLGVFGNALGGLLGNRAGQTTTTQGPAPDPVSQGIGMMVLGNSLRGSGGSKGGAGTGVQ